MSAARLLGIAFRSAGQQAMAANALRQLVVLAEEESGGESLNVAVALTTLGMTLIGSPPFVPTEADVADAIRVLERSL